MALIPFSKLKRKRTQLTHRLVEDQKVGERETKSVEQITDRSINKLVEHDTASHLTRRPKRSPAKLLAAFLCNTAIQSHPGSLNGCPAPV
jgi:hypothetical protein